MSSEALTPARVVVYSCNMQRLPRCNVQGSVSRYSTDTQTNRMKRKDPVYLVDGPV